MSSGSRYSFKVKRKNVARAHFREVLIACGGT